MDKKKL